MRAIWNGIAGVVVSLVSPALAGITVTEFRTTALTNAFAPLSQSQYFAQQTLVNVSPALAEVSGDWMGTNAGGSTITWHFVGSSRATSSTIFDANNLTVTAAGEFAYEINTTADFIDPRSSSIFSPSGAANYRGFFEVDIPVVYMISAQLNQRSRVSLTSFEGATIFDRINLNPTPLFVNLSGTIQPGHYQILASTSLIAPNFANGINHFVASGSFENVNFSVQVPEPNACVIALSVLAGRVWIPRRRFACIG